MTHHQSAAEVLSLSTLTSPASLRCVYTARFPIPPAHLERPCPTPAVASLQRPPPLPPRSPAPGRPGTPCTPFPLSSRDRRVCHHRQGCQEEAGPQGRGVCGGERGGDRPGDQPGKQIGDAVQPKRSAVRARRQRLPAVHHLPTGRAHVHAAIQLQALPPSPRGLLPTRPPSHPPARPPPTVADRGRQLCRVQQAGPVHRLLPCRPQQVRRGCRGGSGGHDSITRGGRTAAQPPCLPTSQPAHLPAWLPARLRQTSRCCPQLAGLSLGRGLPSLPPSLCNDGGGVSLQRHPAPQPTPKGALLLPASLLSLCPQVWSC